MDSNEFWCRAFLAAMDGNYMNPSGVDVDHERSAFYCEKAADVALDVAQRRGMIPGERAPRALAPLQAAALRWLNALRANHVDDSEAAERDLLRAAEALDRGQASSPPELERVEFTAERHRDLWTLHGPGLGVLGIQVLSGRKAYILNSGTTILIKWSDASPQKPIEVWIERREVAP